MRFVAFLLVVLIVLPIMASTGAAQIVINEFLADPASDWDQDGTTSAKLDEWLEIMNVGTSAVDLSRFRVSDASAGMDFRFALSGTLASGEVRVFFGSEVVAWQTANGVSAFGLSLNNGGDTVYLYEVAAGDTNTVDSYTYVANQGKDDRSAGRLPNGTGIWVLFDGLNPFAGTETIVSTGCLPSPGGMTACATPTASPSSALVQTTPRGLNSSTYTCRG